MKLDNFFNFKRFFSYLKIDLEEKYKNIFLVISIIILATVVFKLPEIFISKNFVVNNLDIRHLNEKNDLSINFDSTLNLILIFAGSIIASLSFSEIYEKRKLYNFLTLPISNFEKLLSRYLYTTIIFYISVLLAVWLSSIFILIISVIINAKALFYNPFTENLLKTTLNFFIVQTIYFSGSIFFKKKSWLKTTGSILALIIVASIITSIIFGKIFFYNFINNANGQLNLFELLDGGESNLYKYINILQKLFYAFFIFIINPILLFAGYYKLKEIKIVDAI